MKLDNGQSVILNWLDKSVGKMTIAFLEST